MKLYIFRKIALISLMLLVSTKLWSGELPIYPNVGGNFQAQSSQGEETELSQFSGRVVILFFGYTNCPDVCPVTLSYITRVLEEMDEVSDQIQVLFVTIDPDHDTASHLHTYLKHFNPNFLGITGTRKQIDRIVDLFKARYEKEVRSIGDNRFQSAENL